MNANRQLLHELIDIVDVNEMDILYRIIAKFIPSDEPALEEAEAIYKGREQFKRGEFVNHAEINWD
jgi:tetrahydromethanopterin S-methyltransferase subunit A